MAELRSMKVFSGTPNEIARDANEWMDENDGKVDIVEQKTDFGNAHYGPTGVLCIIYRKHKE